MANPHRNEMDLLLTDDEGAVKTYTLRLNNNDLASLETASELGEKITVYIAKFATMSIEDRMGMREALLILRRGLITGSGFKPVDVAKILDAMTPAETITTALQLLVVTFTTKEEKAKEKVEEKASDPLPPSTGV